MSVFLNSNFMDRILSWEGNFIELSIPPSFWRHDHEDVNPYYVLNDRAFIEDLKFMQTQGLSFSIVFQLPPILRPGCFYFLLNEHGLLLKITWKNKRIH